MRTRPFEGLKCFHFVVANLDISHLLTLPLRSQRSYFHSFNCGKCQTVNLLIGPSGYYTRSQTIITEVFTMNQRLNPQQKDSKTQP